MKRIRALVLAAVALATPAVEIPNAARHRQSAAPKEPAKIMALNADVFSPDSNNDSQTPTVRRQKISALLAKQGNLGDLFNSGEEDTTDLSST
jgi:hypothetical protein